MALDLKETCKLCYDITQRYLSLPSEASTIISETQRAIKLSQKHIINDVFAKWDPFNGEISFSYNGGKDCQVLLLIYLGCLWEFSKLRNEFPLTELPSVFIASEDLFATLDHFITMTSDRYNLSLYKSPLDKSKKVSMSQAFQVFLNEYPQTKAILIGIRSTDPYGASLLPIQSTDPEWPQFMRLQPLLHWKLSNIWSFLLFSGEPICGLYEIGFTSIGGVYETKPNPHLMACANSAFLESKFQYEIENSFQQNAMQYSALNTSKICKQDLDILEEYIEDVKPGWHLTDDALERLGRVKKQDGK